MNDLMTKSVTYILIATILLNVLSVPLQAQITINEVMVQPSTGNSLVDCGNTSGHNEWIELFNVSKCDTADISCFVLGSSTSASNSSSFMFPQGTKVPPLGRLLIGGNIAGADFNLNDYCGTSNLCGSSPFTMADGDGWVGIYDNNGDVVEAVFWTSAPGQPTAYQTGAAFATAPCFPTACGTVSALTAPKDMVLGIELSYAGAAPGVDQVVFRGIDGSGSWLTNGTPSPNDCNGPCPTGSDLAVTLVDSLTANETCLLSNGSIGLEVTGGQGPYDFRWNDDDNDQVRTELPAGVYTVTVIDDQGCRVALTDTVENIGQPIDATIDPQEETIFIGDDLDLDIITTNIIDSVRWTPPTGLTCYTCESPVARPNETTIYTVQITDIDGCVGSATTEIKVLKDQYSVFVPTAFTPNGDNLNDVLFIRSPKLENLSFRVFDRWGQEMFYTNDPTVGWDGKNKQGVAADAGVYVYYAEVDLLNGTSRTLKGNVTLLR